MFLKNDFFNRAKFLSYNCFLQALEYALKIFNYFFTAVFILELFMKLVALGFQLYLKDRWNQLDVGIVILSVIGIVLEELQTKIIPINPTIIRVMRVLRIARGKVFFRVESKSSYTWYRLCSSTA